MDCEQGGVEGLAAFGDEYGHVSHAAASVGARRNLRQTISAVLATARGRIERYGSVA
jgi:hypothetical protein